MSSHSATMRDVEVAPDARLRVVDGHSGAQLGVVPARLPASIALQPPSPDLRASRDDDTIVVTDDFSTVYGVGDDVDAAVTDYLASLVATLDDLEAREFALGPGLREELTSLRRRLVRVQ